MRIVKLAAENILRLKAVEIVPDGDMVVISGKNGAGKTSVLDSILIALAGGKLPPKPLRDGTDEGKVVVDIGDYVIEKILSPIGATLKVRASDGSQLKSPQTLLNKLVGDLTWDPVAFLSQSVNDQRETLLRTVGVDLRTLDESEKDLYSRRHALGVELRKAKGAYERGIQDLKDSGFDFDAILKEDFKSKTLTSQDKVDLQYQKVLSLRDSHSACKSALERLQTLSETRNRLVAELQQTIDTIASCEAELNTILEKSSEDKPCTSMDDLSRLVEINADLLNKYREDAKHATSAASAVGRAQEIAKVGEEVSGLDAEYKGLTDDLNKIQSDRQALLRDAKMPIENLSIDERGITFNEIPLQQCSQAEQLYISSSIAMAMNPRLRILRIQDGSLLDSTSMEILKTLAKRYDFQVWVEVVDESGTVGLYIEDGEITTRNATETKV